MVVLDVLTCWNQVKTFGEKFGYPYVVSPFKRSYDTVDNICLPLSKRKSVKLNLKLTMWAPEKAYNLQEGDFHPTATMWRNIFVTHKRMILRLMSGRKGKGEGKACWLSRLSLWSSGVSSPSSPSCCCHVGRVWMSTNWERAPRGSIPSGSTGWRWVSEQPRWTQDRENSFYLQSLTKSEICLKGLQHHCSPLLWWRFLPGYSEKL